MTLLKILTLILSLADICMSKLQSVAPLSVEDGIIILAQQLKDGVDKLVVQ